MSHNFLSFFKSGKPQITTKQTNTYYGTEWNETEVAKLFYDIDFHKIKKFYWVFANFKEMSILLKMYSDPIASVIAWIVQPCFNLTSCTPLKQLVRG